MSRLKELIDELCPDGVEYRNFDEVCTLKARVGWQRLTKKEHLPSGEYMLVTGTDFTDGHGVDYSTCVFVDKSRYEMDENIQLKNGDVLITKDGTLGKVAYVDDLPMPATLNGGVFVVRPIGRQLEQRFNMHFLLSYGFTVAVESQHTGSTIKHLTQAIFSKIKIPVPPIEVQREIVRILDSFQELDDALTAEIEAREKQFEHYRDALFSSRLPKLCPDGVEYKALGVLGSFFGGLSGKTKADFGEGYPFVTYMNVFNNAKVNPDVADYVRINAGEKQNALHLGDVLFTVSSETPDECGMSSVVNFEPDGPLYLNSFCTGWRPNGNRLLPDYMAYVLRSWELRKQISKTANGVIRFNVSKPLLAGVRIPVPPIEVQREIVSMLDAFQLHIEALVSERDARRKQFAHYRDKLLSFPEKVTVDG